MKSNPWTKKNPFMSMWLSGANTAIGRARGPMQAAAKRQARTAMETSAQLGARAVTDFWTAVLTPSSGGKRTRKRR